LPDSAVVDVISPYYFQGPQGLVQWWSAIVGNTGATARSTFLDAHEVVTLEAATAAHIKGDDAYFVIPFSLALLVHGTPQTQYLIWIVSERNTPDGWRISGQAFQ